METLVKENAKPGLDLHVEPYGFTVNNDEKFIVIQYRRWLQTSDGQKLQIEHTAEKVRNQPEVSEQVAIKDDKGVPTGEFETAVITPAKPDYDENFSEFKGSAIFEKIKQFIKTINL